MSLALARPRRKLPTCDISTPSGQIPSPRTAAFPKGLCLSRCWMESVVERAPRLHVLTHTPLPSSAERANRNTGPWGLEGGAGTLETEEKLACFHRGKRGRRAQCRLVGGAASLRRVAALGGGSTLARARLKEGAVTQTHLALAPQESEPSESRRGQANQTQNSSTPSWETRPCTQRERENTFAAERFMK